MTVSTELSTFWRQFNSGQYSRSVCFRFKAYFQQGHLISTVSQFNFIWVILQKMAESILRKVEKDFPEIIYDYTFFDLPMVPYIQFLVLKSFFKESNRN